MSEALCSRTPCSKCIYHSRIGAMYACDYIIRKGHSRPCPAGKECTVYKAYKGGEAKYASCNKCGKTYLRQHANTKYCVTCAKEVQLKRCREASKRKSAENMAAEMKVDKICRCCGGIFHTPTSTNHYCDDCRAKWSPSSLSRIAYDLELGDRFLKKTCNICGIEFETRNKLRKCCDKCNVLDKNTKRKIKRRRAKENENG